MFELAQSFWLSMCVVFTWVGADGGHRAGDGGVGVGQRIRG